MTTAPAAAEPASSARSKVARWHTITEWPLAIAAIVFLVAYSIEVIADVPDSRAVVFDIIIWATWVLFAIDYLVTLILVERRWHWFVHNLPAAAILVVPALRPLRLFRVVAAARMLHRVGGRALRGRILTYGFGAAILLAYLAALAVLDAEQNVKGANIHNIGDAAWWAVVTLSGVGYGDYYPVTLVGRLVGVGLMIGGIAIIGIVAGSLASWLIEQLGTRVAEEAEAAEDQTRSEVAVLSEQVARLTALIETRLPDKPDR
ncbi:MAG TPA: potassium channel family protein [Pseudolysinimonas sp.]|jgi:voltage-gated potassium channel